MLRRSPSRTLIASAVLLACLTLTGQSSAQTNRSATAAPLTRHDLTTLIARAHRILIADSARGSHSLLSLPAATAAAVFLGHAPTHAAHELPQPQPGLWHNEPWMRTSRAWAS